MHHPNLEKLKALKLFGMARALEDLNGLHAGSTSPTSSRC